MITVPATSGLLVAVEPEITLPVSPLVATTGPNGNVCAVVKVIAAVVGEIREIGLLI